MSFINKPVHGNKILDPEQEDKLIEMVNQGKRIKEVIGFFGISRRTYYRIINAYS
ncbi:helix-turn-helix domain-containing protein [Vibrio breoganii]